MSQNFVVAIACTIHNFMECGWAVDRASALRCKDCDFDSHWVSTLVTLGKLLILSQPQFTQLKNENLA